MIIFSKGERIYLSGSPGVTGLDAYVVNDYGGAYIQVAIPLSNHGWFYYIKIDAYGNVIVPREKVHKNRRG
jgi:hypothetical protein